MALEGWQINVVFTRVAYSGTGTYYHIKQVVLLLNLYCLSDPKPPFIFLPCKAINDLCRQHFYSLSIGDTGKRALLLHPVWLVFLSASSPQLSFSWLRPAFHSSPKTSLMASTSLASLYTTSTVPSTKLLAASLSSQPLHVTFTTPSSVFQPSDTCLTNSLAFCC